jgi:uncharacterized protein YndB with AHSA1/START domain
MENIMSNRITVETTINAPIEHVWACWNEPMHIVKWCFASDDWHAPHAEADFRVGGKFKTTMAAKDGSFSFDFGGEFTVIEQNKQVNYTMDDGRTAEIRFTNNKKSVQIIEVFDAEETNPIEMQRDGWQAILNNFKAYAEK